MTVQAIRSASLFPGHKSPRHFRRKLRNARGAALPLSGYLLVSLSKSTARFFLTTVRPATEVCILHSISASKTCYADLIPGVPLHAQAAYALMWIKEPFLSSTGIFEKTVAHGHTVTDSRQCGIASHRIGIDTGAYATGDCPRSIFIRMTVSIFWRRYRVSRRKHVADVGCRLRRADD